MATAQHLATSDAPSAARRARGRRATRRARAVLFAVVTLVAAVWLGATVVGNGDAAGATPEQIATVS